MQMRIYGKELCMAISRYTTMLTIIVDEKCQETEHLHHIRIYTNTSLCFYRVEDY